MAANFAKLPERLRREVKSASDRDNLNRPRLAPQRGRCGHLILLFLENSLNFLSCSSTAAFSVCDMSASRLFRARNALAIRSSTFVFSLSAMAQKCEDRSSSCLYPELAKILHNSSRPVGMLPFRARERESRAGPPLKGIGSGPTPSRKF